MKKGLARQRDTRRYGSAKIFAGCGYAIKSYGRAIVDHNECPFISRIGPYGIDNPVHP